MKCVFAVLLFAVALTLAGWFDGVSVLIDYVDGVAGAEGVWFVALGLGLVAGFVAGVAVARMVPRSSGHDGHDGHDPGVCPGCHGEHYEVETDGYDGEEGTRLVKSYSCITCGCRWEEVYDALPLEVFIERQPGGTWGRL